MITQKSAEKMLLTLTQNKTFAHQAWSKAPFGLFKLISTTEKGDIGEDFLAELLTAAGHSKVKVIKGRRGQYDVSLEYKNETLLFEVKVATEDTSGAFQFNGIRYDTTYTHLFCFGISPNELGFIVVPKAKLGAGKYKMVPMARGSNASFKLTRKKSELLSFSDFKKVIDGLI